MAITASVAGSRANPSHLGLGGAEASPGRIAFEVAQTLDHPASFDGRAVDAQRQELSAADASTVYRFVARRVDNGTDAADIAQQALLLACTKRDTCRGENLSAWLLAIARHLIVDYYRAKNRFQFVEVAALVESESALRTPPDSTAVFEGRERLKGWRDCITQQLRLEEQVAVLLADVHDHHDKDSAAVLRMSVPSFKLLLHGARARLRKAVSGNRKLMPETSAGAWRGSAKSHGSKTGRPGTDGPPVAPLPYRTGVTCRLGAPELRALRNELLESLKL